MTQKEVAIIKSVLLFVSLLLCVSLVSSLGCEKDSSDDANSDADDDTDAETGADANTDSNSTPAVFDEVKTYETTIDKDVTDIYYPIPSDSQEVDYSFPVAILLQGANVDKIYYKRFSTILARYGFIVVVPNHGTPGSFFPQAGQAKRVHSFISTENTDPTSPLAGIVDTEKTGIMGHSFGGMQAFSVILQKQYRPDSLMAGSLWGSASVANPVNNGDIAIMMSHGTLDSTSVVAQGTSKRTYNSIKNPPKALVEVMGANHYGQCDVNNPKGARKQPPKADPTLDQAAGVETIARWTGMFFRAHMLNNKEAIDYVHTQGDKKDKNVTITSQLE